MGLSDTRVKVREPSTHHLSTGEGWCEVITYSLRFKTGGMRVKLSLWGGGGASVSLSYNHNHMGRRSVCTLNQTQLIFRDWVWCRGSFRDYGCGGGGRGGRGDRWGVVWWQRTRGYSLSWSLSDYYHPRHHPQTRSVSPHSLTPRHWQSGSWHVSRGDLTSWSAYYRRDRRSVFLRYECGDDVGVRRNEWSVFHKRASYRQRAFPRCAT
jgi:hypothetical protein